MPHKILVVDDNEDFRSALVSLLRHRDYQVQEADNGKDALFLASKEHPDLIILDLHMPQLGGWEVCRQLKSDPELSSIHVIMTTADHVAPEDAEYGLALGADEYVVKPFVNDVLMYNVVRLLDGPTQT